MQVSLFIAFVRSTFLFYCIFRILIISLFGNCDIHNYDKIIKIYIYNINENYNYNADVNYYYYIVKVIHYFTA